MAKQTNYDSIDNIMYVINFNREKQVEEEGVTTTKYQPITVECRLDAKTTEGATRGVVKTLEVGQPQDTELTTKQIHTAVSQVHASLGNLLKQAVLEGVNEDPSL